MGRAYREISTQEAQDHDRRINRIIELRKRLEHTPSSEFTVIELVAVLRIMGQWQDLTQENLELIERKLDDLMSGP